MIELKRFESGLEYIEISNRSAGARISLQGAHLFHYQREGELPLMWLSGKSRFEPGKAIRGGVPICWPWFGPHPSDSAMPQHGFARTSLWELIKTHEKAKDVSQAAFRLKSSPENFNLWPFHFELLFTVTVGRSLSMHLTTRNLDTKPFEISSALHSYIAVSDITKTQAKGLEATAYYDKVKGLKAVQSDSLRVDQEIDRVYQGVEYPLSTDDGKRIVTIDARGSSSAVVWNPWKDKCAKMADMPDDGWKTMLCIEAANALEDARVIGPGEEHTLTAVIC